MAPRRTNKRQALPCLRLNAVFGEGNAFHLAGADKKAGSWRHEARKRTNRRLSSVWVAIR